jgi:tetratricopeptide (TPR) repeat protein
LLDIFEREKQLLGIELLRAAAELCALQIAGLSGAATAQSLDRQQCPAADPDLSISGCTAVIQSGHETRKNLAVAFYNRGNVYLNRGNVYLHKAIEKTIEDFYHRGFLLNPGLYERAIEDFDQAIRLNPNDAAAFDARGIAYARRDQYDRAIEDFDQAIRLNPNDAVAFVNRGNVYAHAFISPFYDRAIEDYDQAIRLDPNDAVVFYDRGGAYLSKGQPDRAIQDFDQAIRLNPTYMGAFNNRGFAYVDKRQYDRAIQDYDQALRINPNNADALRDRELAKRAKGDHP